MTTYPTPPAPSMSSFSVSMPMPFPGTPEKVAANYDTHAFYDDRCMDCDCRPWGVAVTWPCGASVPRIDVTLADANAAYAGTPMEGAF